MKHIITIIFALAMITAKIPSNCFAQEVSIGIKPAVVDVVTRPGTAIPIHYTLENGKDPTIVTINIVRLEPKKNTFGFTIFPHFSGPFSFSTNDNSLKLLQSTLLDSNERQTIDLMINADQKIEYRSYYYALSITAITPGKKNSKALLKLEPQIISPILLSISSDGRTTSQLSLSDVKLDKPRTFVDSMSSPGIEVSMRNSDIYHTQVQGTIFIRTPLQTKQISIAKTTLFPQSNRAIFSNKLPLFLIGPTKVKVQVQDQLSEKTYTRTISFFVFPYKITFVSLLVLVLTYLVAIRKRLLK